MQTALIAETFGARPSELLGLSDPWEAYCFDEALLLRLSDEHDSGDREIDETNGGRGNPPPERLLSLLPTVES